jgi:TolA-binding protein
MKILVFSAIILSFLTGCNSKTDQDYMNEAAENAKKNNIPEVIANYENLLKEYPESKLAPEALFQMGTLYQNKMVKNLSETESLENSVKVFKRIYNEYPDYPRAPDALFMSAFILANELKKYDEATGAYKLFLEKYPNHEWCIFARSELENMGLPPEVILEKKQRLSSDGRGF